ncbi:O-antigen ligase family protein [Agrococcus casei]|uniref:O-antigen ligase family protein n=1 Tax=Agrococcus casei TaxID=343512 RepID=UPI003F8FF6B4
MTADRRLTVFACVVIVQVACGDMVRNLIGWAGWGVTIGLVIAWSLVELWLRRREVPYPGRPALLFVAMAFVSAFWAGSWWSTLMGAALTLGIAAAALVIATLSLRRLVAVLHWSLQGLLIGSLVFEIVAALWIGPIRPVWHGDVAGSEVYWWTPAEILTGGRISGLTGNANLTGMLGVMALIIAVARAMSQQDRRLWPLFVVVPLASVVLSQSATVVIILAGCIVAAILILIRFRVSREAYYRTFWSSISAMGGAVIVGAVLWQDLAEMLGKSPDLTGRLEFWRIVLVRWLYSPIVGDGWMGYWMPWVEPYGHLLTQGHAVYLQAHNVWLDVALQLGIVGLIIFVAMQITSIRNAVSRIRYSEDHPALRAVPLLLLIALVVQGFTESRPLTELGALLLFMFAAGLPQRGERTLPIRVQKQTAEQ